MPDLKAQLQTVTVTLPESGAVCEIGLAFGDHLKIESVLTEGMKMKVGGKKIEGEEAGFEQEISGDVLDKQKRTLFMAALKKWDMTIDGQTAEINLVNIGMLTKQDGDFLYAEISKLSATEVPKDVKKK